MAAVTLLGVSAPTVSAKTATPVQASTYPKTELRSFVRNVFAQNNSRGSTVIIKNGRPQQISYGWAWYGKKIGNGNEQVVYPTGSLQKIITAAMVIQLMNEKWHTSERFTQNTKISRWFPNLKNADNITVGE